MRGFISLARLQAGAKPEFENMLKSIELSGTDATVRLSFAVSPETLRVIAPRRGAGRPPRTWPENLPTNPTIPAPPTTPSPEVI